MKLFASVFLLSATALAQTQPSILGHWQGEADSHGHSVPVYLDITGTPSAPKAVLVNGSQSSPASSATFTDGHLVLTFDYFARTLDATLADGKLTGTFGGARGGQSTLTLQPAAPAKAAKLEHAGFEHTTDVLGHWEVETKSAKGEAAWDLLIDKSDAPGFAVRAVIQRIDGDTGALYGNWNGTAYEVSHFTAAGPALYTITPQADGTLLLANALSPKAESLVARRPAEARKENLAPPTETTQQTTLKDPNTPLAFSFPDLNGKVVSNTDPRFAGKVVIVAIGGSWCPNCHDEAPFLESLYKQFHSKGLEIVNLSFEEEAQLKDPERLRAFIRHYGITYNVLLAGTTDQLNEKITQANNLNCWPTSFFIGRDGKVKEIHAGFAGPGNPTGHKELTHEVTELVEHLLDQPAPVQAASVK